MVRENCPSEERIKTTLGTVIDILLIESLSKHPVTKYDAAGDCGSHSEI
jgi:hypothetical protein